MGDHGEGNNKGRILGYGPNGSIFCGVFPPFFGQQRTIYCGIVNCECQNMSDSKRGHWETQDGESNAGRKHSCFSDFFRKSFFLITFYVCQYGESKGVCVYGYVVIKQNAVKCPGPCESTVEHDQK